MTHLDVDQEEAPIIDPVYGAEISNYPSDRGRLLLIGGSVYFTVTFVVNAAFASVDAATAAIFVIGTMAALAVLIGWLILHLWNREVILFERGFSYREGSRNVYFLYAEVQSIQQRIERVSYFGGLIRRNILQITVQTKQDETIVLDRLYRKIDELSLRLEQLINRAQHPIVEAKLEQGTTVAFGEVLSLTQQGIHLGERVLAWNEYAGCDIGGGRLTLKSHTEPEWGRVSLAELENPTLLLEVLYQRKSTG